MLTGHPPRTVGLSSGFGTITAAVVFLPMIVFLGPKAQCSATLNMQRKHADCSAPKRPAYVSGHARDRCQVNREFTVGNLC